MREFKKRRSKSEEIVRLAAKTAGVLLLLVVTVVLLRAAWGMYGKMSEAAEAKEEANADLARVEVQQAGVTSTLSQISSVRGEEAQIRERFGVARPGEGEIDIIRNNKATTTESETKESWWVSLFHTLFVW